MEIAVRELMIEKGVVTAAEVAAQVEAMDARSPAQGAAVVARAWTDPGFRARLLADGSAASAEMGFDVGPMRLIAVENTEEVHNVVVCTLCSCYPRNLLGLPPDWYKSRAYRSRTVREPRRVLAEFGARAARRHRRAGARFDGRHALHRGPRPPGRDRGAGRGGAGRARHARQHDRCRRGESALRAGRPAQARASGAPGPTGPGSAGRARRAARRPRS